MSPYFLSVMLGGGGGEIPMLLHLNYFRFYETPFPHSQNCVAFSYDTE